MENKKTFADYVVNGIIYLIAGWCLYNLLWFIGYLMGWGD